MASAIFEYLAIFHNRQRRHSALGWLTPIEYEKLHNHQPNHRLTAQPQVNQRGTDQLEPTTGSGHR
jgi:hypothetical protein